MSADNLVNLPMPMRPTPKSFGGSSPETSEQPESKEKSTSSELEIEQGAAPFAIDSPRAVITRQDTRNSRNSPAVVNVEKLGPWLIVMTFALGLALSALAMILYFGPTYVEALIEKSVAQAETRIRTDAAQGAADAKSTAHVARTTALVAIDKVEDIRVKLAQRNINLPPLDGH
jgi:hypothetical protein